MKRNPYFCNTVLAALMGCGLFMALLVRTFVPAVILPKADIPGLVLLSLMALLTEYYFAPGEQRRYAVAFALSAVTFALLPLAAGFTAGMGAVKLGFTGGIVFTAAAWAFDSIRERLSSGEAAKAAPVCAALGLYLAAQGLAGIFL